MYAIMDVVNYMGNDKKVFAQPTKDGYTLTDNKPKKIWRTYNGAIKAMNVIEANMPANARNYFNKSFRVVLVK